MGKIKRCEMVINQLFVFLTVATQSHHKYIWTGSPWIWQQTSVNNEVNEGSGRGISEDKKTNLYDNTESDFGGSGIQLSDYENENLNKFENPSLSIDYHIVDSITASNEHNIAFTYNNKEEQKNDEAKIDHNSTNSKFHIENEEEQFEEGSASQESFNNVTIITEEDLQIVIIVGVVSGILIIITIVTCIVFRMRKKREKYYIT